MKELDKWAERIYSESDFGKSIATTMSGIVGLTVYLSKEDWVISAFALIISFPIFRLVASSLNQRYERKRRKNAESKENRAKFNRLSEDEKQVIESFVKAGGSVLTWTQVNNENISSSGVESLIQRGLVWASVTADGMTETFALDSDIFDIGYEEFSTNSFG